MVDMKTTVEIPDPLFRRAKSRAAQRGVSLKQIVTEALREKLAHDASGGVSTEPPWMRGFGKLSHLRRETGRVQARIDDTFEVVELEDRA
jgi:hypothetical protein